jgi:hypothetical protein
MPFSNFQIRRMGSLADAIAVLLDSQCHLQGLTDILIFGVLRTGTCAN